MKTDLYTYQILCLNKMSSYYFQNHEEKKRVRSHVSYDWLKTVCDVTDDDLKTFQKIIQVLIDKESKHVTVMDKNGNSFFVAIIAGFNDKGVFTFRKDGDIIGEQ